MITRRRGNAVRNIDIQSIETEVTDTVETVQHLQNSSECLLSEHLDLANFELDDIFECEDLKLTFDRHTASPVFNMGLTDLGMYNMKDEDPEMEPSTSPYPERRPSDLMTKSRQYQSGHISNKNAIAARLNRLKKKEYVGGLEEKVANLSTENHMLKQETTQLTKRVEELEDETRYLRAVLANESVLAQLLSRLSGVNGMKISTSLFQAPNPNDHDYALPKKRVKVEEKETSGGICLHVEKNHVSVEFCTKCAESASMSLKM